MKYSLPILALLAASTLTTPIMAQDMSSFLNPRAMAAELGLGGGSSAHRLPQGYTLNAPRISAPNLVMTDVRALAALTPDVSLLAPRTSMAPVPRRSISRVTPVAPSIAPTMANVMAEARAAAPAGANIAIISGANTAVVNGEVIHSSPEVASSPRLTLWQRIFGI